MMVLMKVMTVVVAEMIMNPVVHLLLNLDQ